MQIAHATDIGLRTLFVLAGGDNRLTTVAQLAAELQVPVRYLGKIVQRLSAVGWVTTARGRGGGLHVSQAGRRATVADVIGAFEEGRRAVNCTDPPCPRVASCSLQTRLMRSDQEFLKSMASVSIEDLV